MKLWSLVLFKYIQFYVNLTFELYLHIHPEEGKYTQSSFIIIRTLEQKSLFYFLESFLEEGPLVFQPLVIFLQACELFRVPFPLAIDAL